MGDNAVRDLTTTATPVDDIGQMIDEALADPARAARMSAAIRRRLAHPPAAAEPADAPDPDAEDLWDNVPL
jgi:hypothetical protein